MEKEKCKECGAVGLNLQDGTCGDCLDEPVSMEIDQEYITSLRKTKVYHIIAKKGDEEREIIVSKWWIDSDYETDNDFEVEDAQDVQEFLGDFAWDKLVDYIYELN